MHLQWLVCVLFWCWTQKRVPPRVITTFCAFLQLLRVFTISIISYIGSLSQTFSASDQSPNQFISMSSCVPAAQHYCSHQLRGSLKHINPGASNMETASDLSSYSFHPHVSVILSKNSKTQSNMFYLLIKLIVFVDGTCNCRVCTI